MNAESAPGVKRGGTVNIVTHTIEVICSPEDDSGIDRCRYLGPRDQLFEASRATSSCRRTCSVVGNGDQTLVTIVPPSGYAEEMKAGRRSCRRGCRWLLPRLLLRRRHRRAHRAPPPRCRGSAPRDKK